MYTPARAPESEVGEMFLLNHRCCLCNVLPMGSAGKEWSDQPSSVSKRHRVQDDSRTNASYAYSGTRNKSTKQRYHCGNSYICHPSVLAIVHYIPGDPMESPTMPSKSYAPVWPWHNCWYDSKSTCQMTLNNPKPIRTLWLSQKTVPRLGCYSKLENILGNQR